MKKLFSFLLVGLFVSSVAFAIDSPSDPGEKEGARLVIGQPLKVYQLVRNPQTGLDSTTFASGDVLLWDTVSDDGVTVNRVGNTDITTSSDAVAGVVVGSIPTADDQGAVDPANDRWKNNWGYIQTYGPAIAKIDASAVAVGEGLRGSATASRAVGVGGGTDASASLGFAMDAKSGGSTGDIEIFVRTR